MQVKIKEFNVDMDVKSSGVEFEVRKPDGSEQIGDCVLTMTVIGRFKCSQWRAE